MDSTQPMQLRQNKQNIIDTYKKEQASTSNIGSKKYYLGQTHSKLTSVG